MELTSAKKKFYDIINNIVSFNKVSHAYMIEIDNYEEDFNCVLDFVKLILDNKNENNISALIDSGNYPDLNIIEPDGNVIKKQQVIKLQENFRNKSFLNNKMIYIIKEADKLNDASGNTILKFLEEPEDDIIAILVTTNRYKVIETILSRCQVLSLQDNNLNVDISDNIIDLVKFIIKKDALFVNYQYIMDNILIDKVVAREILNEIEVIFINYLNYISDKNSYDCNNDIVKILSNVDIDKITNYIAIIEEEVQKLDYNVNYKLWLDCLFAKLIGG
ncbi:MAG: hypothetical protein IJE53_05335 [Bacilli bacterium]|nr:hypothetical protein [Bacilli bacterium]